MTSIERSVGRSVGRSGRSTACRVGLRPYTRAIDPSRSVDHEISIPLSVSSTRRRISYSPTDSVHTRFSTNARRHHARQTPTDPTRARGRIPARGCLYTRPPTGHDSSIPPHRRGRATTARAPALARATTVRLSLSLVAEKTRTRDARDGRGRRASGRHARSRTRALERRRDE